MASAPKRSCCRNVLRYRISVRPERAFLKSTPTRVSFQCVFYELQYHSKVDIKDAVYPVLRRSGVPRTSPHLPMCGASLCTRARTTCMTLSGFQPQHRLECVFYNIQLQHKNGAVRYSVSRKRPR